MTERIDAIVALYQPTKAGEALLRSLDLRQMEGEPGFFGSYGFKEWAGVGEASPIGVAHELGHSYWGGFPVEGSPELSWERPNSQELSPALLSYHADVLAFMAQPPDGFEVLRQRLRNLPKPDAAWQGTLPAHSTRRWRIPSKPSHQARGACFCTKEGVPPGTWGALCSARGQRAGMPWHASPPPTAQR